MPRLLSGSTLRRGGSGEFIDLAGAQPQLPPTDSTSTGFTLITDSLFRTRYASSLGNIEFSSGTMYSSMPDKTIRVVSSGSVIVSTSTFSGALGIEGGVGIGRNLYVEDDIVVNGLTIGRGFEGKNNIVIRGDAEFEPNTFNEGQSSIAIGYNAMGGLQTSYKNIAIGKNALATGEDIRNSIAIGDSALYSIGSVNELFVGNITSATNGNPVELSIPAHGLTSGTQVIIHDVNGMTELNDQVFYVGVVNSGTVSLYSDNILNQPVDGTLYTPYASSGTLYRILLRNDNIAIGTDAAKSLIDGELNFFFGHKIAENLTTGSNNFFIGHEVANNMTRGSGNIAIGGDNLIDGKDNQVNIGSVFYYNGEGLAFVNANTQIGLGTNSTQISNGALTVMGGVGILNDVNIGGKINVVGTLTSEMRNLSLNGSLVFTGPGDLTYQQSGNITLVTDPVGVIEILSTTPGTMDGLAIGSIVPSTGVFTTLRATSTITNTTTSTSQSIEAYGGLGVVKDVVVGGETYSYQTGIPEENYLLYTPRVVVSETPPVNPRIGDFWIDSDLGIEFQYIQDSSGNKVWVQFTSI